MGKLGMIAALTLSQTSAFADNVNAAAQKTLEAAPEDSLSALEITGYSLMIAAIIAIAWFLSMGGGVKKRTVATSHGPVGHHHHAHNPYRRIGNKPKKTQ